VLQIVIYARYHSCLYVLYVDCLIDAINWCKCPLIHSMFCTTYHVPIWWLLQTIYLGQNINYFLINQTMYKCGKFQQGLIKFCISIALVMKQNCTILSAFQNLTHSSVIWIAMSHTNVTPNNRVFWKYFVDAGNWL
jgi:hypothetical protein